MIQLTSFSQKISLLVVLSLLSTLMPGPTILSGSGQTATAHSPSFTSPLPTPTPSPQTLAFTSPLPTPPAPEPALSLSVSVEPVGVAPGEVVTLTLRLDNHTEMALTGISVHTTLPDSLRRIPDQPGWTYNAREKRLRTEAERLAAGTGITLTLALRAAGPVDAFAPLTFEAVGGDLRAAATAEVWVVQPGRARVTPEAGGLLVSPDRRAWVRVLAGAVAAPLEVTFEEVRNTPAFLPYGLGRAFVCGAWPGGDGCTCPGECTVGRGGIARRCHLARPGGALPLRRGRRALASVGHPAQRGGGDADPFCRERGGS
ncbi:MAG: hypothetical protein ACP5HM_16905 [Anaerolineae bacterium]